MKPGLYESVVSAAVERALDERAVLRPLGKSEIARRLAEHFGDHLERALRALPKDERESAAVELVNELIAVVERRVASFPSADDAVSDQLLTAVRPDPATGAPGRPQLPLSESGLYVGANRERRLGVALALEFDSADRVDLICAFLFWTGYQQLRSVIRRHLERGRPMRVLTTTYRGVTQARVLDELADLGAEVRVSYETGGTRLHAKAWLFERDSGFSTGFVGSSNLSHSALTHGREWNVRLSGVENRAVFGELRAAFENHWGDEEFVFYDGQQFREVVRAERPRGELRAVFALRARPFQAAVLERLEAERELHGRHRNLLVAATGTGKTVIAALDYARLCGQAARRLKLLFVAHRKEILTQSRDVFRHAMSDGSFGELYVDGETPLDWTHVFASVQSLRTIDLDRHPRDHFDVVIVDEFHHASEANETYVRLLDHFDPTELLGLTATPERADGRSVLGRFDGRIASELRLWDAIDRGLLVPFQYQAIHDTTDLRGAWKRGRYDAEALRDVYTGHHARAHLIVEAVRERIHDPLRMRALAFCVDTEHARFMQAVFERAGIPSGVVIGSTNKVERRRAVKALRDGDLAVLLTVDVFNEGVDIPEVDTVLFLRPTDSSTVFLQQLGRGLRLAEGKRCLTVLDFVGLAHERFRYVDRFRALVGRVGRKELAEQIEADFPFLPSGCSIELDRVSKEIILDNVARSIRLTRRSLATELKESGARGLADFLEQAGLELIELYRGGRTFSELRRAVGLPCLDAGLEEEALGRGIGRLIHVDDIGRIRAWSRWLRGEGPASEALRRMLLVPLLGRVGERAAGDLGPLEARLRAHPAIVAELLEVLDLLRAQLTHTTMPFVHPARVPLQVHGTYRLDEVMSAFGDVRGGGLYRPREGVHFDESSGCNLLFVTLQKDEDDYSPTTMYADYALSPTRFHWQSQSGTRPTDKKGRRHVHHETDGVTPLLFVRERRKDERNETMPYRFLGPVRLIDWSGERPMNVEWELATPMPAETLRVARVVG